MKRTTHNTTFRFIKTAGHYHKLLLLGSLSSLLFTACDKNKYLDINAADRPPLSAKVSFVNARPVNVGLQFLTFTTVVTTKPVEINQASPYLLTTFGNVQINFTEGSSTSYQISRQFGNQAAYSATGGPNGPIPDYYHSVFAARKKTDPTQDTLILFYDNLEAPPAGKAKLRFVHLAAGIPAISLSKAGNEKDSLLFSSIGYGSAGGGILSGDGLNAYSLGPFITIDAGSISLVVKKVEDQTHVPIAANALSALDIKPGKIYTIFLNTVPGDKQTVGAYIITHN
jgi:hypothetical protein